VAQDVGPKSSREEATGEERPMSSFRVTSEIGPLRRVIVHRPGLEIARLTPQNRESLLFDDILWVERAQEEHDSFVEILRSRGAEVLYCRDLLKETLTDPDVRASVIDDTATPRACGPEVAGRLRQELR
jgi:arginine deiminase